MLKLRFPIPRFVNAREIFMEKGALGALKALNAVKAFVLISSSFAKNEKMVDKIRSSIGAHEIHVAIKSSGEPSLQGLKDLLAEIQNFQPDWIIAIGGGSILDSAKILWIYYEYPTLPFETIIRPFSIPPLRGKAKLACLPTTIGTGSEVSSAAVFTDETTHIKRAIVSHELLPDVVILDPNLLQDVPLQALQFSAIDALTHAIEGYVSPYKNSFLNLQAVDAIKIIFSILPDLANSRDDDEKLLHLMMASMMAGWVQNMKIPGLAHALAHQMGYFHIPHGLACALFLPVSIKINTQDALTHKKYDTLAMALGMQDTQELLMHCKALLEKIGISGKIAQYVSKNEWLTRKAEIIQGALKDPCGKANPLALNKALLEEALAMVE